MKKPAKAIIEAIDKAELLDLIQPYRVWIGTILRHSRDFGDSYTNFVAPTRDKMRAKVAERCRRAWAEKQENALDNDDDELPDLPADNDEALVVYFEHADNEEFNEDEYDAD